jgi:hypothetical protein
VRDALAAQPEDALALAPPALPTGDSADPSADLSSDEAGNGAATAEEPSAPPTAELLTSAQLSLFSFVALRLTRRSAEDPDDFLTEQPDPRAPTLRQADGVDALSRLGLCRVRLESKLSELQAQVSLLSLAEPGDDS